MTPTTNPATLAPGATPATIPGSAAKLINDLFGHTVGDAVLVDAQSGATFDDGHGKEVPEQRLEFREVGDVRVRRGQRVEDGAHHVETLLVDDEHVVEPHLAVELVEPAAEGRQEWVRVARGYLAAEDGDAGRVHRHELR